MNFDIDRLKQIPILELANRIGISVRRNKAMCFKGHDRKTPSLSFSPDKNLWHCFGCGLGGNNIGLVKEYFDCSFKDAVTWINSMHKLPNSQFIKGNMITQRVVSTENIGMGNINGEFEPDSEIYEAFFSKCGLSIAGKTYLKDRGYTEETIKNFRIKDIINFEKIENLLLNNFEKTRLLRSGLMVNRRNRLHLIWWDHTILFPFFESNHIVYMQGRRIISDRPKYIGLSGIKKPLYNKDILGKLSPNRTVCICEGITDTLTATQLGYCAIGVLGAASFNKKWVKELNEFRVVVIPDADGAGKLFEKEIREAFFEYGHIIESIRLRLDSDLTDILKNKVKK